MRILLFAFGEGTCTEMSLAARKRFCEFFDQQCVDEKAELYRTGGCMEEQVVEYANRTASELHPHVGPFEALERDKLSA